MPVDTFEIEHRETVPLSERSPLKHRGIITHAGRVGNAPGDYAVRWRYTYYEALDYTRFDPLPPYSLRVWRESSKLNTTIRRYYKGRHALDATDRE